MFGLWCILSGISGPVKCELLPILTIWFVRFRPLMTFNRQETTVNTLLVRYPQFSSWVERTVWGCLLRGRGIHPIPATSYKIEVLGTFVIQESLYPCHLWNYLRLDLSPHHGIGRWRKSEAAGILHFWNELGEYLIWICFCKYVKSLFLFFYLLNKVLF